MSIRLYRICDKDHAEASEFWPKEQWVKLVETEKIQDLPVWAQEAMSMAFADLTIEQRAGAQLLLLTFYRLKGEPKGTYCIEAFDEKAVP